MTISSPQIYDAYFVYFADGIKCVTTVDKILKIKICFTHDSTASIVHFPSYCNPVIITIIASISKNKLTAASTVIRSIPTAVPSALTAFTTLLSATGSITAAVTLNSTANRNCTDNQHSNDRRHTDTIFNNFSRPPDSLRNRFY